MEKILCTGQMSAESQFHMHIRIIVPQKYHVCIKKITEKMQRK